MRQFFAFLPSEVVSRTLQKTTQYARVRFSDTFKRYYKTPFPALNVARRNEDLLTDIIYSDTPAIDDGATCATIFSGRLSHVLDVYGMRSESQFVSTLEDVIRERGAPKRLLSDSAITLRTEFTRERYPARAIHRPMDKRAAPAKSKRHGASLPNCQTAG